VASALERQNWALANELAADMRSRFPAHRIGYESGVKALRGSGRLEEAEALAVEGASLFPDRAWLIKNAASLALRRRDLHEAALRAEAIRKRFPNEPSGYEFGVRALTESSRFAEAIALAQAARARFPDEPWALACTLDAALKAGDWEAALERAIDLHRVDPNNPRALEAPVIALCQLQRIDEADALCTETLARFPENVALIRARQRLESFKTFLARDKDLSERTRVSPQDMPLTISYCRHANAMTREHFGGGARVLERLKALRTRRPNAPEIGVALIEELLLQRRIEEAEAAADDYQSQLTTYEPLALAWATLLNESTDIEQGVLRSRQVCDWFPSSRKASVAYVRALIRQVELSGPQHAEASESICLEALERFPDEEELADFYGLLAQYRGDLTTALSRWQQALNQFGSLARPKCDFKRRVLDASLELDDHDVAPALAPPGSVLAADTQVLMRFENLGSTLYGCEFGGVQRYFGAEPLHLMRWASCPIDQLIDGLHDRFAAFANEYDLSLYVAERGGAAEYNMRSVRYKMRLHTFIKTAEMSPERALLQTRRRYMYLARRLDEELMAPRLSEKPIFVYKRYAEHVSEAQISALFASLNCHGRNALLSVQLEDAQNPAGTVRMVEPDLMVSYLGNFGKTAMSVPQETQNHVWLEICRTAIGMVDNRGE
jgi:tetratricopeptide (TPR) repeat protein